MDNIFNENFNKLIEYADWQSISAKQTLSEDFIREF